MTRDAVQDQLADYIRRTFLDDSSASLDSDTPLLEWGILNSMNTARLLTYIREELGTTVPPTHITGKHLKDLNAITDMVTSLRAEARETETIQD
ncbi:acyl carrier protein [Streptomyces sp. NA02950]|uniref:phosphopantetheine-binding protein n=1 Tax=Streptomyces sp. NA02950 TaxID=2742137 RepID=UPI0015918955|nr:phosphopantetheine-binding protein [Streptomyces sp. NA02950]QKV90523.1 acyl carrier protein [Streptomyces sp. NA02950]